jgi:aspartate 1-decarboxylase
MLRRFLGSKIKGLRITGTNLEYEGSITIDERYIEAAGIGPGEAVNVLNLENGNRFTTYVIKGERSSGIAELNGPAARLGMKGDRIMVLTYVLLTPEEIKTHAPTVVSAAEIQKRP